MSVQLVGLLCKNARAQVTSAQRDGWRWSHGLMMSIWFDDVDKFSGKIQKTKVFQPEIEGISTVIFRL